MTFEFEQYRLRKATREDAAGFFAISQDGDVMEFYGMSAIVTVEDALKQVDCCNQQFAEYAGRRIISEQHQDAYMGDIDFSCGIPALFSDPPTKL